MFLSSVQAYIILPVIAVVVLQYGFALFCLMKLAYLDVSRKSYILWNLFILIVFFIGGTVFLVYFYKHPEKLIKKTSDIATDEPEPAEADGSDKPATAGDETESSADAAADEIDEN